MSNEQYNELLKRQREGFYDKKVVEDGFYKITYSPSEMDLIIGAIPILRFNNYEIHFGFNHGKIITIFDDSRINALGNKGDLILNVHIK